MPCSQGDRYGILSFRRYGSDVLGAQKLKNAGSVFPSNTLWALLYNPLHADNNNKHGAAQCFRTNGPGIHTTMHIFDFNDAA